MRSILRILVVGTFGILSCAHSFAQVDAKPSIKFKFPGSQRQIVSPSGKALLIVRRVDQSAATPNLRVIDLEDRTGRIRASYEFDRRIDGQWSSMGDTLFVNDYQGSDTADCVVPFLMGDNERFTSLTKILIENKDSGPVDVQGIKPPETPDNSHYYLTCSKWINETVIAVELRGVTLAGGEFRYEFRFDTLKKRFELANGPNG